MNHRAMSRNEKIRFLNDLAKGKQRLSELKVSVRFFPFQLYYDSSRPNIYIWPLPRYQEVKKDGMDEYAKETNQVLRVISIDPNSPEWNEIQKIRKRQNR